MSLPATDMDWNETVCKKIVSNELSVAVVGLGYVGLPTAIGFYESGFNVWGVDISERTLRMIRNGENPTGDPDVDDIIPNISNPRWNITSSVNDAVQESDIILVTVPTPVTSDLKPDLSYVRDSGVSIFKSIKPNSRKIVVLESTVYPGVTEEIWLPEIEKLGLEVGRDVEIAYCPERFNPGDSEHGVRQVARVIGCSNPSVGEILVELYSRLTSNDVRYVGKIAVAEAAKVIENVQRDINIGLVNELARIFPNLDIDVEDVLNAASTKWNFHRYTPGVGVGGHCIPVDPYYMIQRAHEIGVPAELISAARAVNHTMPIHVSNVINDILYRQGVPSQTGKVLFLGWSYKPQVGDPRETPASPLADSLIKKGISITAWDPHLQDSDFPSDVEVLTDIDSAENFDMAILITAHKECMEIDWEGLLQRMKMPLIYDGRRVLDLVNLEAMGWKTFAVGRPLED